MWSFLTLALFAMQAAAHDGGRQLTGQVVDVDGKLLADVHIVLSKGTPNFSALRPPGRCENATFHDAHGVAQTDDAGNFAIGFKPAAVADWPRAPLALWAYRDGFGIEVKRLDPESPDAINVRLVLLPAAPAVALRLTRPDGQPAAGAEVRPEHVRGLPLPTALAELLSVTADETGSVLLKGIKQADIKLVRVASPGSGIQWLALPRAEPGEPIGLPLSAVGKIVGQLVMDDGKPVPRTTVRLATAGEPGDERSGGVAEAECDSDGRFQIPAIAAGALSVSIVSSDEPIRKSPHEQPARVQAGHNELRFPLTRPVRVEGAVQYGAEPVAGAKVQLSTDDGSSLALTDESGKFVGYTLPGTVSLRLVWLPAPYYCPFRTQAQVAITEDDEVVRIGPLAVAQSAVFRGRVVDRAGQPVAAAEVLGFWAAEDGITRRAPRNGRGANRAAGGMARRQAAPPPIAPVPPVPAGARELQQSRHGESTSRPTHAWTDQEGWFVITGLPADAELHLWAIGSNVTANGPLVAGVDNAEHVLVVDPQFGVSLNGFVIDAEGQGVPDAAISIAVCAATAERSGRSLESLDSFLVENDESLHTDAAGHFQTPRRLPAELSYLLSVAAPGFFAVKTEAVEPASWQTTTIADIVLSREPSVHALTGRVVDRQGTAIAGATVWQAGDGPRPTETTTAADGSFTLSGVYDQPAIVLARAEGFRLRGKRAAAAEVGEIVLDRVGERTPAGIWPVGQTVEPMPLDERRALARELIAPFLPHLDEPTDVWTWSIAEVFAAADPAGALQLADRPNQASSAHLRQEAATVLAATDFDSALAAIAAINAHSRGKAYLDVFDAVPKHPSEQHERLLEAALANARTSSGRPSFRTSEGLPEIAQRWFDLAELWQGAGQDAGASKARERGIAIAREAQAMPPSPFGQGELAAALARFDGPAAVACLEGLSSNASDWYSADVARGLANYDALEAEITLGRIQRPNLKAHYTQGILQRMAAADADRATTIARALPTADERAYCLGLIAHTLATIDRRRARDLVQEAFAILAQAPRQRPVYESDGSAVVALALLPIVERIDAEMVEDCYWRCLALRPRLPTDGQLNFLQQMDIACIATFVARYDRSLARDLATPLTWHFREQMARRVYGNTLGDSFVAAIALVDPQWALELVRSLPDVPGKPLESPQQNAGLFLAGALVRGERTMRAAYLRDPDAPTSQR